MLVLSMLGGLSGEAAACCMVYGEHGFHSIGSQHAIIVWDEANQMQHFIRRADFQRPPPEFGFLVPTPTQPTLAEADNSAFDRLAAYTARRPVKYYVYNYALLPHIMPAAKSTFGTVGGTVGVLDEATVGGFDAVVLRADGAGALAEWLEKNGFAIRPETKEWLEPIVAEGWVLTAFKVSTKPQALSESLEAVRLSFPTDRPFYPFRQPRDVGPVVGSRSLTVYFFAAQRAQATWGQKNWTDVAYAAPTARAGELLAGVVPGEALAACRWLTTFYQGNVETPEDIYFHPSASQQTEIPT